MGTLQNDVNVFKPKTSATPKPISPQNQKHSSSSNRLQYFNKDSGVEPYLKKNRSSGNLSSQVHQHSLSQYKNWTKRSCKESSRLNELDLARRLQAILTVNHTIILSPNQMGPLSVVWTQELPTVLHRRNSWLNNPMLRPNTLQVSSLHQTFYLLKVKKWVKRVLS
jgi:hypothetical protein